MNKEKVREEIIALRKGANVAYVGSVNREGFPQIKGMLVLESESMKVQYFSTMNVWNFSETTMQL